MAVLAKAAALAAGAATGVYVLAGVRPVGVATQAFVAVATFVPSIAEDLVTRGFWMRVPAIGWRPAAFVAFTTAVYVANHVHRIALGPAEWAMLAAYGLAYGTAAWRARTLWAAVALHWGWNFGGELAAAAMPMEILDPSLSRALSGGAHLLLLCGVLVVPARLLRRDG